MTDIITRLGDVISTTTTQQVDNEGNRVTLTETTTVETDGGTHLTDVNYIPWIRGQGIEYISYNMRPSRQVWHYFDDENMDHFIQRPNIIELDTRVALSGLETLSEDIEMNGANTHVLLNETNVSSGFTRLYTKEWDVPTMPVLAGNTATSLVTGLLANVVSYHHSSGFAQSGSNVSNIILAEDAESETEDFYVGNTITITVTGESSNIVSYNTATRTANVSPAFNEVTANSIYSISDRRTAWSANNRQGHYTSERGFSAGVLWLPDAAANTTYRFHTGDRIFRILDNPANDIEDYTTRSDYRFTAVGLSVDKTQIINRQTTQNVTSVITTVRPPPSPPRQPTRNNAGGEGAGDPSAQQFFVPSDDYPEGMFVPSINLYFKNKDDILPIELQIRPMVNGIPSSYEVLPGASVVLEPEDVNISDSPNTANALTVTTFTFPSPVYLMPGKDYAWVAITNSHDYDMYVAELGETILGSTRKVSVQPYVGSFFKSQNAITYTPIQSETAMFEINKCVFSDSGSFSMTEQKLKTYNASLDSNTYMDIMQLHSDSAELPETEITYKFKATTNANSSLDTSFTAFKPDKNVLMNERKIIYGPDIDTESMNVQITMSTNNPDVSPVFWKNRQNLLSIENIINDLPITNSAINIIAGGSGYANGTTSLEFSGPSGSGANGYVEVDGSGEIVSVIIDSEGSKYADNVSVTITGAGSGANVIVNTETGKSGGIAGARQMSRTVTLADGFDAGDLRTYITMSKPAQSNVHVYYKVINSLDSDVINDKNWNKMQQHTSPHIYSQDLENIEFEFRPSLTSNNITYSTDQATYKTFNQYAIKITMSSTSKKPTEIPYVHDVRTIAFPADVF